MKNKIETDSLTEFVNIFDENDFSLSHIDNSHQYHSHTHYNIGITYPKHFSDKHSGRVWHGGLRDKIIKVSLKIKKQKFKKPKSKQAFLSKTIKPTKFIQLIHDTTIDKI